MLFPKPGSCFGDAMRSSLCMLRPSFEMLPIKQVYGATKDPSAHMAIPCMLHVFGTSVWSSFGLGISFQDMTVEAVHP